MTRGPWVATNATIGTAVDAWFDDRSGAEATYGHISTWDTQHVDDGTRNIHGHCGRDYRDQVLCGVTLSKP